METTVPQAEVVPGETIKLHQQVTLHSGVPVKWVDVRFPSIDKSEVRDLTIASGEDHAATSDSTVTLPATTLVSQPYWLREQGTAGMFRVDDAKLIGRPENPPVLPVVYDFEVGGQALVVPDELSWRLRASRRGCNRRRLDVDSAPVSLKFVSDVQLFAPGSQRAVTIQLTAFRPKCSGELRLDAPDGWRIVPDESIIRPRADRRAG